MRSVLILMMVLTAAALPADLAAAGCDGALRECYRSTILFSTPEAFDVVGCDAEYLRCLGRALVFY